MKNISNRHRFRCFFNGKFSEIFPDGHLHNNGVWVIKYTCFKPTPVIDKLPKKIRLKTAAISQLSKSANQCLPQVQVAFLAFWTWSRILL